MAGFGTGTFGTMPFGGVQWNLIATGVDGDTITLTWDAYTGASGYDIERDNVVIVTNHPTTSYTDESLSPGTEYCYQVRAVLDEWVPSGAHTVINPTDPVARLLLPTNWGAGDHDSYPPVIYCHGSGADQTQVNTGPTNLVAVNEALANAGHPVLCVAAGNTWGSWDGVNALMRGVAYLRDTTNANVNRIGFIGGSMGACTALNYIARNMTKSAFFVGITPVADIDDIHTNGSIQLISELNAAYDWPLPTGLNRNPITMAADGLFGVNAAAIPMQIWYGDSDTVTIPAKTEAFNASVGTGVDINEVVGGTHTNVPATGIVVADITAFVAANFATTPADPGIETWPAETTYDPSLDADLTVWVDFTDASTMTFSTGVNIATVTDKSPNGYVFTAAGGNPTHDFVVASNAAERTIANFTGAMYMDAPAQASANDATTGHWSVFAAIRKTSASGTQELFVQQAGTVHDYLYFGSGQTAVYGQVRPSRNIGIGPGTPSRPPKGFGRVVATTCDDSFVTAYEGNVAGTPVATNGTTDPLNAAAADTLRISSVNWGGQIMEILAFSRVMSTADRNAVLDYLGGRIYADFL